MNSFLDEGTRQLVMPARNISKDHLLGDNTLLREGSTTIVEFEQSGIATHCVLPFSDY